MKNIRTIVSAIIILYLVGLASSYTVFYGNKNVDTSEEDATEESFGATFRPSGIEVNLREDLVAGASRTGTTLNIDPVITLDGRRVIMSDIGDIAFGKIDQGNNEEEIISWTGMVDNTNTYQLTGVEWGYNFYNNATSTSNYKKHISGSRFIITNDDHFIAEQYGALDASNTWNANQIVSSTTNALVKWCFGDCTNYYLWHNTTTGQVGYASSSSQFTFTSDGTTFVTNPSLDLSLGVLKVNTSTSAFNEAFLINTGGYFDLSTTTSSVVHSFWNDRYNATTTKNLDFTFSDDLTIGGNATTTGSMDVGTLCFGGANCITGITSGLSGVQQRFFPHYPPASSTIDSISPGADVVNVFPLELENEIDIDKFIIGIGSGADASRNFGIGIYNLDGTQVVESLATIMPFGNISYVASTTATTTVSAGSYLMAWTTDNASVRFKGFGSDAFYGEMVNHQGIYWGTAANSSSAGNLPATLGTITAATENIPMVTLSSGQ